jgi:hypothetical protein
LESTHAHTTYLGSLTFFWWYLAIQLGLSWRVMYIKCLLYGSLF